MTLNIGGVEIGGRNPCRFVAELSNNANGDPERMGYLIRAAKEAGADLIKTQCYDADEIVAMRGDGPAPAQWGEAGWTMRDLYAKAATPFAWFDWIPDACVEWGIPWFSSVFGPRSFAVLEAAGCPAYKIARLDESQKSIVALAASSGKPVLISTADVDSVTYLGCSPARLFCPVGYPVELADVRLTFGGVHSEWGLSSHCMDPLLPVAAVARGCKLIEMHFQLDDEPSELEANVSLTASQFRRMVDDVRRVEAMLA